jgi:hypothetical protein
MYKAIALASTLGMAGALYYAFNQSQEVKRIEGELKTITDNLNNEKEANKRLKVVNAINDGATNGLHATKPDVISETNRVIEYILTSGAPTEEKFYECWDRKLKTTNWGSMGPYGLLDDCIDKISSAKTAILMREIDNKVNAINYECRSKSATRFEGARDCMAERNYRLIVSANHALFEFVTTKNWIENQEGVITEE